MNNYLQNAIAAGLIIVAVSCQSNASDKQAAAQSAAQNAAQSALASGARIDTIFGMQGMDMVSMRMISSTEMEYKSPKYTIRTASVEGTAGESIIVSAPEYGGQDYVIPNTESNFFMGISGHNLVVDKGTGPDGRKMEIHDLKLRGLSWQAAYVDTAFVVNNAKLWYWTPVPEDKVTDTLDCPQKADWLAKGLRVGYAQRQIFNLEHRAVVTKSEFKCVPMQ
jgi:hypothetical protein